MRNLAEEIEKLEIRAAEVAMVADLSADPVKKEYNRSVSEQLSAEAEVLRQRMMRNKAARTAAARR